MSALVIGVGQPWRGDDAAGPAVVQALEGRVPDGVGLSVVPTPVRLADAWEGHDVVVVVDAVISAREPGSVSVIEVGADRLPARSGAGGTHGFGVAEAIELARATGRMPLRLVVVGIEAREFTLGSSLSPTVGAAVGPAAEQVLLVLE